MARFFVGQRVRLVRPDRQANMGLTGVITHHGPWTFFEKLPDGSSLGSDRADCFLRLDQRNDHGLRDVPADYDQLEPILDQKHEACDEDFKRDLDRLLTREGVSA